MMAVMLHPLRDLWSAKPSLNGSMNMTPFWLECDAMVSYTGKTVVKKPQYIICSKFQERL